MGDDMILARSKIPTMKEGKNKYNNYVALLKGHCTTTYTKIE